MYKEKGRQYNFIGGLFLFLISWLSSDHYQPWMTFQSEGFAFLGLLVISISVFHDFKFSSIEISIPILVILFAIFLPWIQYATGIVIFAGDALISSFYLSCLLISVFVGCDFSRSTGESATYSSIGLMHVLWLAAMVSAAIGLVQWLNLQEPLSMLVVQTDLGDRAMGNLGQPNQLATLLLMGMVAFAYIYEQQIIGRLTFFTGISFMTGVLILTQSRTGMLSLFVLTFFLMWKKRAGQHRLPAKAVATWAALFIAGTLALPSLSEALLLADVRSISSSEPVSQRWKMWQQMAYAVAQSPWVGYGWNQTPTAHAAGAVAFPSSITYTNAHNFVVDLIAWNGLPLGILLTAAIAYWFVTRMRSSARLDAVHAMACLLPFAVHSMLEYPFAYAYFLLTAGLMIGIVEGAAVPSKNFVVNVRWAWIFLAAWIPIGAYITYEYFLIEEDFRVVRFENLRIGKTPETYAVPNVWMISHMAAMLVASRQRAAPEMSAADLENLRKVSDRFAYGAVRFRYALSLALNGDPAGASRQLAIIRGMYGEAYYAACKVELLQMQAEKYPQLSKVTFPD